jgi:hypothetical protein
MIQRSQTLYLLAVFILSVLMLTGPLSIFTTVDTELILKHAGLHGVDGEEQLLSTWPLTVIFSVVALLSFLNIFFYRNRMRQMRICVFLMFLSAGSIGLMFYYNWVVGAKFETTHTLYQWRFVLPAICIILQYLARRRIHRDELLVKAYDRIR